MADQEQYMSLKPSDAVHTSATVPEGRYKISDAKFGWFDYNGTVVPAVPALGIEFQNPDEQSSMQWYSAGDARNFQPTDDGKRLRAIGSATGANDSTNCFMFLSALVNAGFPEDRLGNDISILIGLDVDVIHQAIAARDIKGKKVNEKPLPVIAKIHAYPGDKKPATTAAQTKPKGSNAKANGSEQPNPALPGKALDILTAVLREAEGRQMEKKGITTAAFKKIASGDTDRAALLNLLIDNHFLSGLGDSGVLYDTDKSLVMYVGE